MRFKTEQNHADRPLYAIIIFGKFFIFFSQKSLDKLFKSLYNVAYPTSYFTHITLIVNAAFFFMPR